MDDIERLMEVGELQMNPDQDIQTNSGYTPSGPLLPAGSPLET